MTHPNEQTLFSFDIMFKGILYKRVETYLPLFRIGKQPGLEASLEDPRLDHIHLVFHLMQKSVWVDATADSSIQIVLKNDSLPHYVKNEAFEWGENFHSFILNDDVIITNMTMGQVQQMTRMKGVHAAIEKDIRETMLSMGITYGSIAELTPEQRMIHQLVTKFCTYIFGQSRTINHLQNVAQQATMTAHRCFNTVNVLSECLFQMSNMDRATYQALNTKVLEAMAAQAQTGHSPPSPVDATGEAMMRGPRSRLPSEAL